MNERAWSTGGMIQTGDVGSILRNTCCSVNLANTYPTWTGLGMNLDLNGDRTAPEHLIHGTDIINQLCYVCIKSCDQTTVGHPGALQSTHVQP